MASSTKITKYLDMPVQHFADGVLKRMNRRATEELIHQKIATLRSKIPGIVLRTSIIVGFPGETEEDFQALLTGIKKARFNHLGVFKYSDEEEYLLETTMPLLPYPTTIPSKDSVLYTLFKSSLIR
jgi:ribosomal protein S12 methylthiotransferase